MVFGTVKLEALVPLRGNYNQSTAYTGDSRCTKTEDKRWSVG